jgi:hypothetical protein
MSQPIPIIKNYQDLNNTNVANLTESASKSVAVKKIKSQKSETCDHGAEKVKRLKTKSIKQDQKSVESSNDDDDCCFVEMNKSAETIFIDDDSEIDEISEKSATSNQAQKRTRYYDNQLNNINYEEEIDQMKSLNFKQTETKLEKSKDQTMTTRNDSVLTNEESDEPPKKFQREPKRKRMKKDAIQLQNDQDLISQKKFSHCEISLLSSVDISDDDENSLEKDQMHDKMITMSSVFDELELNLPQNPKENILQSDECSEASLSSKSIENISNLNKSGSEATKSRVAGHLQNFSADENVEITEIIGDNVVQFSETIEIDSDDDDELSPSNPNIRETQENFVCNLSYSECHEGTVMKCNIENCNFATLIDSNLKYHVQLNHFTATWNGSCLMCQTASSSTGSLLDECNHMLDIHINKKNLRSTEKSDVDQETEELNDEIDADRTESADELTTTNLSSTIDANPVNVIGETNKTKPKFVFEKTSSFGKQTLETTTEQSTDAQVLQNSNESNEPSNANEPALRLSLNQLCPPGNPSTSNVHQEQPNNAQKTSSTEKLSFDFSPSKGFQNTSNISSYSDRMPNIVMVQPVQLMSTNTMINTNESSSSSNQPISTHSNLTSNHARMVYNQPKPKVLCFQKWSSTSNSLEKVTFTTAPSSVAKLVRNSINFSDASLNTHQLRPWLSCIDSKHPIKVAAMMKTECLLATYKCMGSKCNYSTNLSIEFSSHLEMHKRIFDHQDFKNVVKCAYCEFAGSDGSDLMTHLLTIHASEKLACTKCFYRSISKYNVRTHFKKYHDKTLQIFMKCKHTKKLTVSETSKEAVELRQTNVLPIKCPGEIFSLSSKQIHKKIILFFTSMPEEVLHLRRILGTLSHKT